LTQTTQKTVKLYSTYTSSRVSTPISHNAGKQIHCIPNTIYLFGSTADTLHL
jgi:hypothetical protein